MSLDGFRITIVPSFFDEFVNSPTMVTVVSTGSDFSVCQTPADGSSLIRFFDVFLVPLSRYTNCLEVTSVFSRWLAFAQDSTANREVPSSVMNQSDSFLWCRKITFFHTVSPSTLRSSSFFSKVSSIITAELEVSWVWRGLTEPVFPRIAIRRGRRLDRFKVSRNRTGLCVRGLGLTWDWGDWVYFL